MEDLNIICFLWNGDRWNVDKEQGYLYVNKLYRAIQKHLSLPHCFICLSNLPKSNFDKGIEIMPLTNLTNKGCLPKLSMFNPELGLKGQVLSFDIDIVITGSLDEIASYRGEFAVRSSFKFPYLMDGDIVGFNTESFNSELIWLPLKLNTKHIEKVTGGRERFMYRQILGNNIDIWQNLFPGQLLSYKNHLIGNKQFPNNARIVSCHGRPRPHELTESWAIENWRNL